MLRNFRSRAVAATALLMASLVSGAPASAQEESLRLPVITVTEVVSRPLVERVRASGSIRAVEEVQAQPQVEGLSIRALNADIGDSVEEGAVLAVLDEDSLLLQKSQLQANRAKAEAALAQLQAQVTEVETSLADARRQLDRTRRLSTSGTATRTQLEQAEALVDVTEARLNAARQAIGVGEADIKLVDAQIGDTDLRLARTGIKAPVSGTVSVRNARIGAIASGAGSPLFTIIRNGEIELVADVAEADIRRLAPGQQAFVSLPGARAGERIEGRVRLVSPTIDAATRLGTAHISLDGDSGARPGMYAAAEIVIAEKQALALPISAVTVVSGAAAARKVDNGTVTQAEIVTGIEDGGYIEIVEGLAAGDVVVAKAGAFVRDGDRITPVSDETAAAKGPER